MSNRDSYYSPIRIVSCSSNLLAAHASGCEKMVAYGGDLDLRLGEKGFAIYGVFRVYMVLAERELIFGQKALHLY